MRKLSKVLLGLALTVVLTTGCGATKESTTVGNESPATTESKEVTTGLVITDTDDNLHFTECSILADTKENKESLANKGLKEISVKVNHGTEESHQPFISGTDYVEEYITDVNVKCDEVKYTDRDATVLAGVVSVLVPKDTKVVEIFYTDTQGNRQIITVE